MVEDERPAEISWTLQVQYKPDGAWSDRTSELFRIEDAVAFMAERQAAYPMNRYRLIRVTTTYAVEPTEAPPAVVAQPGKENAPTPDGTELSDYDFLELVAFAHKVQSEGFGYAFEEYPPTFEAPELAPMAADYALLRSLFDEWEEALDEFWTRPDAGDAYDAHIEEADRRRRTAS